jgi:hypothetical protein
LNGLNGCDYPTRNGASGEAPQKTAVITPVLEARNLSWILSGKRLVDNITVRFDRGEVLAIVGPSVRVANI